MICLLRFRSTAEKSVGPSDERHISWKMGSDMRADDQGHS